MTWLVISASQVVAETADEAIARNLVHTIALNGAVAVLAQKLAQCEPYPQPQWTEVNGSDDVHQ